MHIHTYTYIHVHKQRARKHLIITGGKDVLEANLPWKAVVEVAKNDQAYRDGCELLKYLDDCDENEGDVEVNGQDEEWSIL